MHSKLKSVLDSRWVKSVTAVSQDFAGPRRCEPGIEHHYLHDSLCAGPRCALKLCGPPPDHESFRNACGMPLVAGGQSTTQHIPQSVLYQPYPGCRPRAFTAHATRPPRLHSRLSASPPQTQAALRTAAPTPKNDKNPGDWFFTQRGQQDWVSC